ncbi:MAG: hypothetical protein Q8P67_03600 [archaeon]|nr:hypothetical protein [archaeon]
MGSTLLEPELDTVIRPHHSKPQRCRVERHGDDRRWLPLKEAASVNLECRHSE